MTSNEKQLPREKAEPDTITEEIAVHYKCAYAHPDAVVEVWEPAERFYEGLPPNREGCLECGTFVRYSDWIDAFEMD